MGGSPLPAPVGRLAFASFVALALAAPADGAAQVGGVWDMDEHVCGDCHGSHPANPVSVLVRRGNSSLAGQVSGMSLTSVRCLGCHGIQADRAQARSDRPMPMAGATYLGPSLGDEHPLGRRDGLSIDCATCHQSHDPWIVTQQTETMDQTCVQCHSISRNQGDHATLSCGICHKLHNPPSNLFRESNRDAICGACHLGAPLPVNPGIDPVIGPPVHASPSGSCRECHQEH